MIRVLILVVLRFDFVIGLIYLRVVVFLINVILCMERRSFES